MTRQLLKIGNSSPSETSVTFMVSINDGFFSGLFNAAVKESRMDEAGESFKWYAVCRYWAIVWAINTLNQSRDSGWWVEWCILFLPGLADGLVGTAL
jgi:hypothetical protein